MIVLEGPGADEATARRLAHQLRYDHQEIDLSPGFIAWARGTYPGVVYYGSLSAIDDPHDRTVLSMMLLARGTHRAWAPESAPITVIDNVPTMHSWPPSDFDLQWYEGSQQRALDYRRSVGLHGIGSLTPRYAFVGETPNPRSLSTSLAVPFSVGPAGRWLTQALRELGITASSYLTNAVKHDGDRRTVREELRWLRPKIVIALGQVASGVLTEGRIAHHTIVHPQYARRFHHRQNYANVIKEVIEHGDFS